MALGTYIPGEVSVSIAGHIITGYIDGSFIDIEYSNDRIVKQKGADGETARVITSDDSGMFTIRLQQTSASNDVLSGLFQADIVSGQGAFPISVKDNSGNTLAWSDAAWIKQLPATSFSNSVEEREWAIDAGSIFLLVGGNS